MLSTILSIATIATGLLASTATAAFDASSKNNVAIYWGQGANQKPLDVICSDPSVDIVNIGFVNGFPKTTKEYPKTNFGEYIPNMPGHIKLTASKQTPAGVPTMPTLTVQRVVS